MAFSFDFHRNPLSGEPTADDIVQFFPNFLGTDVFLYAAAAEQIVQWLQNADPAIVPDALDLMVRQLVVRKFAELFRGSTAPLESLAGVIFGFLASGDTRHATIAYNSGIVPVCIERLSSTDFEARIRSAWILGNLAADDVECATDLTSKGVLGILFTQMSEITQERRIGEFGSYACMLLWAINHFLKSTPGLPPELVVSIQDLLSTILLSNEDDPVLEEACYGLAAIAQLDASQPQYGASFTSDKACGRLVRLLQRGSNMNIQRASLQLIGALTARSDDYTTRLLNAGLLPALAELIEHPLGEDACWVLANIVAENVNHLAAVVSDPRVLPTVIRLLKVDSSGFDEDEYAGRTRECCSLLAGVVRMGQVEPLRRMVSLGGVSALCTALRYVAEEDVLVIILDALWKVVLFGESDRIRVEGEEKEVNVYLRLFEESGGFEGLYRLENKRDRVVAEAAQQMLALIDELMNPPPADEEMDDGEEHAENTENTDGMVNGNGLGHGDFKGDAG
ncbi:hypothetical protein M408DRAFT_332378 [Serendipita vermifera MAFF 305830]|uniref:Importin subunit alpha n=2 Tax=Serendipita vermifera MAFF 305830 TaxID=933852 RepID=A0A0C2WA94_SERVB|nr:hypothetical protein M408DRAFT_332378 [Serendipita vermifera MAFF 305830]